MSSWLKILPFCSFEQMDQNVKYTHLRFKLSFPMKTVIRKLFVQEGVKTTATKKNGVLDWHKNNAGFLFLIHNAKWYA